MKGFKKDGKFRPTGNKTKSSLKKSNIRNKQTVGVNEVNSVLRTKGTIEQRYSKEDIQGGEDFFYNQVGEVPQEWLQIIGDEYPLSKKTHDNLWEHNMLGYIDWDDPEGKWSNTPSVVVLTDKDKDSFIRYWIDNRKEDDVADQMIRDRDEELHATARKELGEIFGTEINEFNTYEDELGQTRNAFQKFEIGGWEDNLELRVIVPFSVTPEKLKEIEKTGWKVESVGNGITLAKGGFAGKVR